MELERLKRIREAFDKGFNEELYDNPGLTALKVELSNCCEEEYFPLLKMGCAARELYPIVQDMESGKLVEDTGITNMYSLLIGKITTTLEAYIGILSGKGFSYREGAYHCRYCGKTVGRKKEGAYAPLFLDNIYGEPLKGMCMDCYLERMYAKDIELEEE